MIDSATDVRRGVACRSCGLQLETSVFGRVGGPPFGRQVPGTTTADGTERVCPACDARPDGPPWRTDMLDFPTAWAIQRQGGIEHGPQCSSVPGWHPLSGPSLLCDCDAVEAEWNRCTASAPSALALATAVTAAIDTHHLPAHRLHLHLRPDYATTVGTPAVVAGIPARVVVQQQPWQLIDTAQTPLIGTDADPAFVAHQTHQHPRTGCGCCPTEDET